MTDDQPRWKFRINARGAGFGQKTQYEAICPTCPDEWHREDGCLQISGKEGENLVQYTHLKANINALDPIDAVHDQENGRTDVLALARNATGADAMVEQEYQMIEHASKGGGVITSNEVHQRTGISPSSFNRHIKRLVGAGRVVEASPYVKAIGTAATYRVGGVV